MPPNNDFNQNTTNGLGQPNQNPPQSPQPQQPQQPPQTPQPFMQPQQPQVGAQPNLAQAQPVNNFQQQTMQTAPTAQKSGSGKGIAIVLVLVFILIPAILGVLYGFYAAMFSPKSMSKKASTGFMNAITTGDVATALTYTDGSAESKKFLDGMAPGVKATSYMQKASASKSGKWYYLYTLEGATNKTARTELEKDGKWQITGFLSGDNLALVGTESNNEDSGGQPSSQSAQSSQCLVQSDFDNWYKKLYSGKSATESSLHFENPQTPYSSNVHFPADSLDYKSTDNTGGVENMVNLANDPSVKGKSFTIHIYGGVGTSQADSDFANKRAEVVKNDLITGGVSAENIVIDPPQSATDYESNPDQVSKGMSRVVVLKFVSNCDQPTSPSNGR